MKINKIKISPEQLTTYKGQEIVRRQREVNGGYDQIIIATDQDLDRRKPIIF